MALVLRLRLPSASTVTLELTQTTTCGEAALQIADATSLTLDSLVLFAGFPPHPIALEPVNRPVRELLSHMETVMVKDGGSSVASGQAGGSGTLGGPPKRKTQPPKKSAGSGQSGSSAASPACGGVVTLSDVGNSGGHSGGAKKRAAPTTSADGSARAGGKRRTVGALQLGSKEGIGESLIAAVSRDKRSAVLHREDPALAFFKAAAGSALIHHQEEVLANDRFKAALAGSYKMAESTTARRGDGEPCECVVRFKVGRSYKDETFELLSIPELRGVVQAVLEHLDGDGNGGSLDLLKPFKMAHVSPRVFWNLVHRLGGDVGAGLKVLVPSRDW
eukprot:CAMPEP_0183344488 /NCGR_PEP_ID=MMETSP0164_2-20130417/10153_1 /TAXON_ID=221442 /ORGANISM="Coccolithus pelagicus ssp braarudi, Strain PLY182g" /LENGTH=332 /DNA_ID=CAMNT_0025515489 /DNA_START=25 /DNA_END=1020 /DNA_ORIENTATION=-